MKNYFPHDYNARNDPKLLRLRMLQKMAGLGLYWCIIEMLFEQGGRLEEKQIPAIAFELHVSEDKIRALIDSEELFFKEDGYFTSNSVLRRLEKINEKSKNARDSALERWKDKRKYENELFNNASQFYVLLLFGHGESFIKIGFTNVSISRRYTSDKMPYNSKILAQYFSEDALKIEKELCEILKEYSYDPKIKFGGHLECYTIDAIPKIKKYSFKNIIASQCDFNASQSYKGNKIKEKELNNIKETVDVFHKNCVLMPKLKKITDTREGQILARVNEYSLQEVLDAMIRAAKSDFLNGKIKSDFVANFDFLIKKANFIKLIEGNYDNKTTGRNAETDYNNDQTD